MNRNAARVIQRSTVLSPIAHIPGLIAGLDVVLRSRFLRRTVMAAAPLTARPLPDELLAGWFAPLRNPRIRADLRAVLQGISPNHTLAAAERLAQTLPCARLELIDDARTYVQIDQPRRLAELI